ncbi:GRAM domain-containing protein [Singulisphaera sp. PoT]|uniref:GRAM domain-containing protein n=1 Tax=Singulisphaera sp. PoT TaxID=3411797 RepID=UPI003BF572F2
MVRMLKLFAMTALPFGAFMTLFFWIMPGSKERAIIGGMTSGLLFGVAIVAFTEWQRSRSTKEVPDLDGERLIKDGPANHFRGLESVGGWLYLTDHRLYFRSHRFNVQNHELTIPLSDIRDVKTSMTLGIVPNGLLISTGLRQERFVVVGRKAWVEEIRRGAGVTT